MKAVRIAAMAIAAVATSVCVRADVFRVESTDGNVSLYSISEIADLSFDEQKYGLITPNINGHEFVDLGLPSGTKWAKCNVGAMHPTDLGNYYAWGMTSLTPNYDERSCSTYEKSFSDLRAAGVIYSNGELQPNFDVASALWGSEWKMPTKEQMEELCRICAWEWTTVEGRFGCVVTGPNGNSIFLPAGGLRTGSEFDQTIYVGYYWTKKVADNDSEAFLMGFDSSSPDVLSANRFYGLNVRPVTKEEFYYPLPAPQNVKAVIDGPRYSHDFTVTWDLVPGATKYKVYVSGNDYEYFEMATTAEPTYRETRNYAGWIYYKVQALADGARSELSEATERLPVEWEVDSKTLVIDGHECVDMALPSGTLWAKYNMGSNAFTDGGNYYFWGEIDHDESLLGSSGWGNTSVAEMKELGATDDDLNLTPEYDIVHALWGSDWRIPTADQCRELIEHITGRWVFTDGHFGWLFTATNGNQLFVPAVGYISDGWAPKLDDLGYLYTGSITEDGWFMMLGFSRTYPDAYIDHFINRNIQCPLRPVIVRPAE